MTEIIAKSKFSLGDKVILKGNPTLGVWTIKSISASEAGVTNIRICRTFETAEGRIIALRVTDLMDSDLELSKFQVKQPIKSFEIE